MESIFQKIMGYMYITEGCSPLDACGISDLCAEALKDKFLVLVGVTIQHVSNLINCSLTVGTVSL